MLDELSGCHVAIGAELLVANSDVSGTAADVHNPLTHVAAEMKDEIADSVLMGSLALPDLLVGEFAKASVQIAGHLFEFDAGGFEEESSDLVVHELGRA